MTTLSQPTSFYFASLPPRCSFSHNTPSTVRGHILHWRYPKLETSYELQELRTLSGLLELVHSKLSVRSLKIITIKIH